MCIRDSYIPSASPPERFTEVLRAEHDITRDIWGPVVADRILGRMLDIQQGSPPLSEPPAPMVHVGQQPAVDAAMAAQMTQMSMRLFGNPYFRSIVSVRRTHLDSTPLSLKDRVHLISTWTRWRATRWWAGGGTAKS